MLATGAEIVIDLHDWVPSWGEDVARHQQVGDDLQIQIEYEVGDEELKAMMKTLTFKNAMFHLREKLPGPSKLTGAFTSEGVRVCEVADLGRTEVLNQWLVDPANSEVVAARELHHFFILFWEARQAHHVVAEQVTVS